MKTAVEYLIGYINHLNKNGYQFNTSNDKNIIEKALEMEKQKRVDAFDDGYQQGVESMVCTIQDKEWDGVDDGREYVKVQDWSEMRTRNTFCRQK
jgi:hypothetical protein